MGFSRRFLLPENSLSIPPIGLCNLLSCDPEVNTRGLCVDSCFKVCPHVCKEHIVVGDDLPPPYFPTLPDPSVLPPPPPPSPLPPKLVINQGSTAQKHLIRTSMIVGSCMIGVSLLLCIVFAVMRFYSSRRNNPRRRRSSPILFATSDDFLDEDHGPVLDHPIWYIHTVGLSQALIDSITVCKYRKDEGLIEGTDCSVCLSEFEEDESLRLLPKCSHAFHIPCIDTWLRAHKNCPLCRAPIVCGAAAASDQVSVPESSIASGSSSGESTRVENSESVEGVGRGTSEVGSTDDENVCAISVESSKVLPNSILAEGSCDQRALSDLADNRRASEDDVQPIRRSVSVDSMSASSIYRAVANILPEQGSSNSQLVLAKSPNSGILSKQDNASSSLSKHWRSSSSGFSLQMVPMAMKRPFPSGRKLFSSKHRRTLSSILPL